MKILLLTLLMLTAIPMLSACQATARGDDGYVSVGTNDYNRGNNDDGYFCPPGQAKKGRC